MRALPSGSLLNEIVLDHGRQLPIHAQLKTSLRRLILEKFEDTNRFFSEAHLIDHLHISQGTVRRALTDLAADGLLEKRPAKGTIVRKNTRDAGLRNLAVFVPAYFSSNTTEILTLMHAESLKRQILMQPFFTQQGESLLRAYKQVQFRPQDGAVVLLANSPMATAELTAAFQEKGYECISVDTLLDDANLNFVGVNNRLGIETGMDYLTSLGHRNIAFLVNEPAATDNIQERIAAFQGYHRSGLKLKTSVVHTGTHIWENSSAAAFTVMEAIWNAKPRPTAIFAVSDSGAISAVQWLSKREIRVPEEISVLGFDGSNFGAMIHPSLSSVANQFQQVSDAVFSMLDKVSGTASRVFVTPTLVVRDSTGPRPKGIA